MLLRIKSAYVSMRDLSKGCFTIDNNKQDGGEQKKWIKVWQRTFLRVTCSLQPCDLENDLVFVFKTCLRFDVLVSETVVNRVKRVFAIN